jgi:hypothetical protein
MPPDQCSAASANLYKDVNEEDVYPYDIHNLHTYPSD